MKTLLRWLSVFEFHRKRFGFRMRSYAFHPQALRRLQYLGFRNRYVLLYSPLAFLLVFAKIKIAFEFLHHDAMIVFLVLLQMVWLLSHLHQVVSQFARSRYAQISDSESTELRQAHSALYALLSTGLSVAGLAVLASFVFFMRGDYLDDQQWLLWLPVTEALALALRGYASLRVSMALARRRVYLGPIQIYGPQVFEIAILVFGYVWFGPAVLLVTPLVISFLDWGIARTISRRVLKASDLPSVHGFGALFRGLRFLSLRHLVDDGIGFIGPRISLAILEHVFAVVIVFALARSYPKLAVLFSLAFLTAQVLRTVVLRFPKSIVSDVQYAIQNNNLFGAGRSLRLGMLASGLGGLTTFLLAWIFQRQGFFGWLIASPRVYVSENEWLAVLALTSLFLIRQGLESFVIFLGRATSLVPVYLCIGIVFAWVSSYELAPSAMRGAWVTKGDIPFALAVAWQLSLIGFWIFSLWPPEWRLMKSTMLEKSTPISLKPLADGKILRDRFAFVSGIWKHRLYRDGLDLRRIVQISRLIGEVDNSIVTVAIFYRFKHELPFSTRDFVERKLLSGLRAHDALFEFPSVGYILFLRGVHKSSSHQALQKKMPWLLPFVENVQVVCLDSIAKSLSHFRDVLLRHVAGDSGPGKGSQTVQLSSLNRDDRLRVQSSYFSFQYLHPKFGKFFPYFQLDGKIKDFLVASSDGSQQRAAAFTSHLNWLLGDHLLSEPIIIDARELHLFSQILARHGSYALKRTWRFRAKTADHARVFWLPLRIGFYCYQVIIEETQSPPDSGASTGSSLGDGRQSTQHQDRGAA